MTTTNDITWNDWLLTDRRVPLHLRVVVLAYRDADPTDVLFLNPGELAQLVGSDDRRALGKAVSRAVEQGFLTAPSGTTALRLSPVGGGDVE